MFGGGWGPFLQWVVRLAGDFFKLREGTGAGVAYCDAIGRGGLETHQLNGVNALSWCVLILRWQVLR